MELLTAAQMRAIEQAAIESGEVTGLELMERAGRGVFEAIFEEWPELQKTSHRAVVLCGPGNNGGDGFVVARLLKEWGWEVEVFLYGDPDKLPPDARVNYERWGTLGEVNDYSRMFYRPTSLGIPDLYIDALFGTGLRRPVDLGEDYAGTARSEIGDGLRGNLRHVAIDIPSGVCSDSGKLLGDPFVADLTVTFHSRKVGHLLEFGPGLSGRVTLKDIGIPSGTGFQEAFGEPQYFRRITTAFDDYARHFAKDALGKPEFKSHFGDTHKYTHGHALILTGGPGRTGAARLTARGALRIGAGLVTLGCPQNALSEVAALVTAIMTRPIDDAPGLRETLEDEHLSALCLGPGLGLDENASALVDVALRRGSTRHIVLDADALTLLSRDKTLFDALHDRCVLTPHTGEFRRLFPDIAEKLDAPATAGPAYSKVDATREAAARAGCTVLFKGPDTVIADQTGRCSINSSAYDRAAPWLATAGSGDVLAGFVTGLLARGFGPMQAAETAAWLHTECALSFGPGLIAEDIPEELPTVFSEILK